jgi:DNA-binding NtrC family response regulator
VRIVCATNLSPQRLADENLFRQDLLYRINTVEIALPPLRERREDIPLLLEHFVRFYAQKYNFPVKRLSAAALDTLSAYDWPGNVRALRHAVERAVILSEDMILEPNDFPLNAPRIPVSDAPAQMGMTLDALEKATILQALDRYNRNVSRAAKSLGLTRASLYRRMEKYGI